MPYKSPLKRFSVDCIERERTDKLALIDHYQPIFNDAEDMAFQYIFNALPLWYLFMSYNDGLIVCIDNKTVKDFGLNERRIRYQRNILMDQGYIALTQFPNVFCVSDIPFEEPPLIDYERVKISVGELAEPKFKDVENWDKRKNFYYIKKKERAVDANTKAYIDRYVKHFDNTFKPAVQNLQEYVWLYSWCLRHISTLKNPNFEHFISGEHFLKTYEISYHSTQQAIYELMKQGYLTHDSTKNMYIFHEINQSQQGKMNRQ